MIISDNQTSTTPHWQWNATIAILLVLAVALITMLYVEIFLGGQVQAPSATAIIVAMAGLVALAGIVAKMIDDHPDRKKTQWAAKAAKFTMILIALSGLAVTATSLVLEVNAATRLLVVIIGLSILLYSGGMAIEFSRSE